MKASCQSGEPSRRRRLVLVASVPQQELGRDELEEVGPGLPERPQEPLGHVEDELHAAHVHHVGVDLAGSILKAARLGRYYIIHASVAGLKTMSLGIVMQPMGSCARALIIDMACRGKGLPGSCGP
jgi:hypothetical protein